MKEHKLIKNTCVFPGSFKTFHKGHQHILKRVSKIFRNVIVLVVNNEKKQNQNTLKNRYLQAKKIIESLELKNVKVDYFEGYTIEYMNNIKCKFIIRGIRNSSDLNYEQNLAKQYFKQNKNIEILYFLNKL